MDRALFEVLRSAPALSQGRRGLTWGEAVRRAKRFALSEDVRRTWVLFGDSSAPVR